MQALINFSDQDLIANPYPSIHGIIINQISDPRWEAEPRFHARISLAR
jgi:hypothetical protein